MQIGHRIIKRRGPDKKEGNLKDISIIFYTNEIISLPTFVACKLTKLPPITMQEYGVGKFLKELECLKTLVQHLHPSKHSDSMTKDSSSKLMKSTAVQVGIKDSTLEGLTWELP